MFKLTPNSIKRPAGVPLKYKKVAEGLWEVENGYEGHYEYFKGRPLPDPKGALSESEQVSGSDQVKEQSPMTER